MLKTLAAVLGVFALTGTMAFAGQSGTSPTAPKTAPRATPAAAPQKPAPAQTSKKKQRKHPKKDASTPLAKPSVPTKK